MRAEEGEEEGKEEEEEEEERSSQQARGGRTSWCGGCQQPRKRKAERQNREEPRSEERPSRATRRSFGRPTRPNHPGGSTWRIGGGGRGGGGRAASSRTGLETLGASEAAPGFHQGGGGSFFSGEQTFY